MMTITDTLTEVQFDKVWDMLGEYPNIVYRNFKYIVDVMYFDGEFRLTHYAKPISSALNNAYVIDGDDRYLTPTEFVEEVELLLNYKDRANG